MRSIPNNFDPAVVAAIDERLGVIDRDQASICLAVESGSRAWGFASPDSDYDCRFLYLRPPCDYLSLWPVRDVIETPLDGLLDVSGWDVAKALRLLVKGNAVVTEWLRSPIVYRGDEPFRDALLAFADAHVPRDAVRRHYRSLAESSWGGRDEMPVKKLFYVLRPIAALRWMRMHDGALPPMHFPTLVDACALPHSLVDTIDRLRAAKAETRELGRASVPGEIAAFVKEELARPLPGERGHDDREARQAADALFAALIDTHGETRA